MNTLAYGILSLLSRDALSGYDLMLTIQPFWQAKHSQIYPLLAKMESQGYVRHVLVEQADKPDKKVYSITDAGLAALRDWLSEPAGERTIRDEMLIKIYSSWLGDHATLKKQFEGRIAAGEKRLQRMEESYAKLKEQYQDSEAGQDILSPAFSRYMLLRRAIEVTKSDLDWCRWGIELVEQSQKKHQG